MTIVLSALIAYVLGSLNFSIILSKTIFRQDVREGGSGNAGATNMARRFGKSAGILTLLGDMLKAAAALYIGHLPVLSASSGTVFLLITILKAEKASLSD